VPVAAAAGVVPQPRGRATVPRYQFPGSPAFLDAASAEIGRPEATGPARRVETLATVATLCAQAADADARHVEGILAEAAALGDQLRAAHRAAELMLADVRAGRSATKAAPESADPPRRNRSASSPTDPRGATRKHG
jgi:hypothetical protein